MYSESKSASNPLEAFTQSDAFKNFGTASATPSADSVSTWTWTLSMPRSVKADLRIVGKVTKADLGRLKKQIEALEEAFDEDAELGQTE